MSLEAAHQLSHDLISNVHEVTGLLSVHLLCLLKSEHVLQLSEEGLFGQRWQCVLVPDLSLVGGPARRHHNVAVLALFCLLPLSQTHILGIAAPKACCVFGQSTGASAPAQREAALAFLPRLALGCKEVVLVDRSASVERMHA